MHLLHVRLQFQLNINNSGPGEYGDYDTNGAVPTFDPLSSTTQIFYFQLAAGSTISVTVQDFQTPAGPPNYPCTINIGHILSFQLYQPIT